MEGPVLFRKEGWYYLITAEGGTGYGHAAVLARSRDIGGPYEADPEGPFLSAAPGDFSARGERDFLKPRFYRTRGPLCRRPATPPSSIRARANGIWRICARGP